MARRRAVRRGLPAAVVAVLVIALAAAVIALAALAIERGRGVEPTGGARPAPSFSFGADASPSPTETVEIDLTAPGPAERFFAVGDGVLWRATAGECGGDAPVIERSDDDGESWADVTPTYREIRQVRDLIGFAETEADIVADLGEDCETQALRTFTQGTFWSPYDDLLPRSTYLDGTTVADDGERYEAPCDQPWSLRTAASLTAVICDGTASVWQDGAWFEVGTDVVSLDVFDGEVVGAVVDADCDGVQVTTLGAEDEPIGCAAVADPTAPAALALTDVGVRVWSGDDLVALER